MSDIAIRIAGKDDVDTIWRIFHTVVASGDTYAFPPETTFAEFEKYWLGEEMRTYVATCKGEILGSYILKPNQPGLGNHVANCGYMTHPDARGLGIGSMMCRHSLDEARALGYRAMQFNLVVATNTGALRLWQKLGFDIIGTIPGAFRHAELGYIDAHIMFRQLFD